MLLAIVALASLAWVTLYLGHAYVDELEADDLESLRRREAERQALGRACHPAGGDR